MNYQETTEYLYSQMPMFSRIGGEAYKEGLGTSEALDRMYGHPHHCYRTIHVAGTNGKGSTSHLIASILQQSGYKVGLYTSPHLVDFRERIRVNGQMIPEQAVIDFVEEYRNSGFEGAPSFFELTSTMAFDYFRKQNVDFAVIEVGLGGRLDSTNIISPILSVITNISYDHTQFLGDTLEKIASEKAGIIKPGIPAIIGEANDSLRKVFTEKAHEVNAPITFAEDCNQITGYQKENDKLIMETAGNGTIINELSGNCQIKNANTVLNAIKALRNIGINISEQAIAEGFANVCKISGLMGRWSVINDSPRTVCDTGHNVAGVQYIVKQLAKEKYSRLHIVLGFVKDKDITHILEMFPRYATYYFTNAAIPRSLPASELKALATARGLDGNDYPTVPEAYNAALEAASADDMIFVGGSTFIVADLLSHLNKIQ